MDCLHHALVGIAVPVTLQQFDLYMVKRIEVGKAILDRARRVNGVRASGDWGVSDPVLVLLIIAEILILIERAIRAQDTVLVAPAASLREVGPRCLFMAYARPVTERCRRFCP